MKLFTPVITKRGLSYHKKNSHTNSFYATTDNGSQWLSSNTFRQF